MPIERVKPTNWPRHSIIKKYIYIGSIGREVSSGGEIMLWCGRWYFSFMIAISSFLSCFFLLNNSTLAYILALNRQIRPMSPLMGSINWPFHLFPVHFSRDYSLSRDIFAWCPRPVPNHASVWKPHTDVWWWWRGLWAYWIIFPTFPVKVSALSIPSS